MSTNSIPPRLLVAGLFLTFSLVAREVRAQQPGSPDPTFGATNSYRGPVYSLASLGDGRVLLGSYELNQVLLDGRRDPSFQHELINSNPGSGGGKIFSIRFTPDKKALVAGSFNRADNLNVNNLVRLNRDGSLDPSYHAVTTDFFEIRSVTVQNDGRVVLGGSTLIGPNLLGGKVARLNPDGALDTDFNASADGAVNATAVQGDGKVLVGGKFSKVNGTGRWCLARLHADGSLDTTYDLGSSSFANPVTAITLQNDNKALVIGFLGSGVHRRNTDGTLDANFNVSIGGGGVSSVFALPDGKILIGGNFTQVNGAARHSLARLNSDGSLDAGFDPGPVLDFDVRAITLAADGTVLAGGALTASLGRIARLRGDSLATMQADHFELSAVSSPQALRQPFPLTITARDAADMVLGNYVGALALRGWSGERTVESGAGTATASFLMQFGPFMPRWTQIIYPRSEVGEAGNIYSLALQVARLPGKTLTNWTIRLKHTACDNFPVFGPFDSADWTTVYQANQTIGSTGWITFPFPAPFAYNGRDNLMVDFRFSNSPSSFVSPGLCYVFQTSENRAFTGGPSLGFGTNQVPNIRWTTRQAFAVTPEYVDHFVNGSWTGNVVVTEPATAMSLYTMDGANRVTEGNPFEVIPDDMDGDGIGDAWAVQYFGHTPLESTTAPDGKWGDKDGDGVSNFAEYISGTDPTNGQSVFKVDPISLAAGQIGLTFHYLAGKKYRVWYSSDLLTWTEIESPVFSYPSADAGQWLGPAAPISGPASRGFYRMSVE